LKAIKFKLIGIQIEIEKYELVNKRLKIKKKNSRGL
jgi:hypothetical protein